MSVYPRSAERLRQIVLATSRGPLRWLWLLCYGVVGCFAAAYYVRGERDVTIYLRNGATRGEFLPGLSDLDIVIVSASPDGARRVRANRDRFAQLLPWTRPILDRPVVLSTAELSAIAGVSAFTYGLDPRVPLEDRGVYLGAAASVDARRVTIQPGLDPEPHGWRRIVGRERRQRQPARDEQAERVATWLELSNWWRVVFQLCLDPGAPDAAGKCVKLMADTAASWLWLEHRERVTNRGDALRRAIRRVPEEGPALHRALQLQQDLTRCPGAPIADLLPVVVRFSARIADLIAAAAADVPVTEVRLAGDVPAREMRIAADASTIASCGALPLSDWIALAWPVRAHEEFTVTSGNIGDPAVITAAARAYRPGAYEAVRSGRLLVMPARGMQPTRLRAIKCEATDPVVFALADGSDRAAFPEMTGWSAIDTARRATAEHRAWLRTELGPVAAAEALDRPGLHFELLLTAARAALFLESINDGDPLLTITPTATVIQLLERGTPGLDAGELLAAHAQLRHHGLLPGHDLVVRLRTAVCELPTYAHTRRR